VTEDKEEWLLTFVLDNDERVFDPTFRQKVAYTLRPERVLHFAWFANGDQAALASAIAEDVGAQEVRVQRRMLTIISTPWVEES
jgi:hypothetical protein